MEITYADGSTDTFQLDFSTGTHGWETLTESFTAAQAYTQFLVRLRYSKGSGQARFDNVTLRLFP